MPLTVSGAARYNVGNIAGAALLASGLGVAAALVAAVLARFGNSREDNPGRLERWSFSGITALLDYAHNPHGLSGLLQVASSLRNQSGSRLGLLLGQAGNRDDDAIRELAGVAAAAKPELVVLKDLEGYMRGREQGEVPAILRAELTKQGIPPDSLRTILPEVEAAQALIDWAVPGDVIVLPVHNLSAREQVVGWLDSLVAKNQ